MKSMTTVDVEYARAHLSALLAAVEQGDEVVIARGDEPVARMVPAERRVERELGFIPYTVPSTFLDGLPEAEIHAWEADAGER